MAMIDERQQHQQLSNLDSFYDLPMKLRPPRPSQLRTVSIMDTLSEMAASSGESGPAWALDASPVGQHRQNASSIADVGADDFLASLFPQHAQSVVSEPPGVTSSHRRLYAPRTATKQGRSMGVNGLVSSSGGANATSSSVSGRSHNKSASSVVGGPTLGSATPTSSTSATIERRRTPEWIRRVFEVARKGDVRALGRELSGLPPALIRSLRDSTGNCLCHVACQRDHLQLLQWLIEVHLQATALLDVNKEGATPVQLAIKLGHMSCIKWLLENTETRDLLLFSSKAKSLGNRTMLHLAAKYGQGGLVQSVGLLMKQRGMDLDGRDSRGDTALHLACKKGHLSAVQALLKLGADASTSNDRGQTALDLSLHSGQRVCRDYLTLYLASLSVCRDMVQLQTQDRLMRETADQAVRVSKEVVNAGRRLQADRDDLFSQLRSLHDHVASLHERMILQLRMLLQENSALRARANTGHSGKDSRQLGEEVERSIEMCESLLEDWRKEDDLWNTKSPNWRELLKKLQLAEENLASLGNSSPFPGVPSLTSSRNKSAPGVSQMKEKSYSPHMASAAGGHHQRISSGAFGVTPDELLRSQMNHVERKYTTHDRRKSRDPTAFDFDVFSSTPSASMSMSRLMNNGTSARLGPKESGDEFFIPPAGFEDSVSDSSDSLQQQFMDDPSPSRIARQQQQQQQQQHQQQQQQQRHQQNVSSHSRQPSATAKKATADVERLLESTSSKKFLMGEFLRHQLAGGAATEDEDDDFDVTGGGQDDDDEENVRSRAAGYWTDGIYASTPLKRHGRGRKDLEFAGRSWQSDLEDESAAFTSTLGMLKKKSAVKSKSGAFISYPMGNERVSLLTSSATIAMSTQRTSQSSHNTTSAGHRRQKGAIAHISKSSGNLHAVATNGGSGAKVSPNQQHLNATPLSTRTLGRSVKTTTVMMSSSGGTGTAAATIARRTVDLSEISSSILMPPLPQSSPPPPMSPASMQQTTSHGNDSHDAFDGRQTTHFRQQSLHHTLHQPSPQSQQRHRSPKDDVNTKLKAMNLMSKGSNCSVLEVIEPPSTVASDSETNAAGSVVQQDDSDHLGAEEPEYENTVAAVVDSARGLTIEPHGRPPPPPVPPGPPGGPFQPLPFHQPQQRLDGFSEAIEFALQQRRSLQLLQHQQQVLQQQQQQQMTQLREIHHQKQPSVESGVSDHHYQSVASVSSGSSGKIRSVVDRFENRDLNTSQMSSCEPDLIVGTRPSPVTCPQPTPSPNAANVPQRDSTPVLSNVASGQHSRTGSKPSTTESSENESQTRPSSAKSHQVSDDLSISIGGGSLTNEDGALGDGSRSELQGDVAQGSPGVSPSTAPASGKKKGFLQKLNLKARWPAKRNKEKNTKRELSPEEFRDTYGTAERRSASGDRLGPGSPDRRRQSHRSLRDHSQTDVEDLLDSITPAGPNPNPSSNDTGGTRRSRVQPHRQSPSVIVHHRQQSDPCLIGDNVPSNGPSASSGDSHSQQSMDAARSKPSDTVLTLGQTLVGEDEDMGKDVDDLVFPGEKGTCQVNAVVGMALDHPDLTAETECGSDERTDALAGLSSKGRNSPGLPRMSLLTKSSPDLKAQLPSDLTSVGTSEDSGVGIGFHRPGSSASKSDSLSRPGSTSSGPGFSFPLRKASSVSVSTDVLPPGANCAGSSGSGSGSGSAGGPDYGSSSGKMSPAPSATESALSPPSDVSKTESARLMTLHHLGRIEEVIPSGGIHQMGESPHSRSASQTGNRDDDSESTMDMSVRSEILPNSDLSSSQLNHSRHPSVIEREDDDVVVDDIDGTCRMKNSAKTPGIAMIGDMDRATEIAVDQEHGAVGGVQIAEGLLKQGGAVGPSKPPIKPKTFKKKTTKGEVFKVTIMEDTRPERKSKAEMKAKRRSERRPWYEEVSDDEGDVVSRGPLSAIVKVRSSSSSDSEEEDFSADETESRL